MVLTSIIVALVVIAISVPLVLRRVPPNDLYGLRTAATRADTEVWYEMNAQAGWHLILWATWLVPAAVALRHFSGRLGADTAEIIFLIGLVISLVALAVWESRRAERLLASKRRGEQPASPPAC